MILLPEMADKDWLHSKFASGDVRASARVLAGPYEGIAFASTGDLDYTHNLKRTLCPGGVPCELTSLLPMSKIITSHMPPWDFIFFSLLTIESGQRRAFEERLSGIEDPEGVDVAAAHVFGHDRIQAVVEVGGNDHDAVLRHLLQVTDTEQVSGIKTLHTTKEHTKGFGGVQATAAS